MRVMLVLAALVLAGCGQFFTPTTRVEGARVESQKLREKITGATESYYKRTLDAQMPVARPMTLPPRAPAGPRASDEAVPKAAPGGEGRWVPAVPAVPPEPARRQDYVERWEWKGPDTETEYAEGTSHGADVRGPGASGKMGEAPEVDLEKGTASGGTFSFTTKIAQYLRGPLILVGAGTVLVIGGIVLIVVAKQTWWGLGATVGGLCLIGVGLAVEAYPWIALVAPLVLLGLVIGVIVYLYKTGKLAQAWTQVVTGTDEFLAKLWANPSLSADEKAAVQKDFEAAQNKAQDTTTQALVDKTQQ